MKIIVLGGAGFVGRVIVKDLAMAQGVTEICIGDYNQAAAEEMAVQCGAGVTARKVDINDASALRDAIANYDVVANTVGPFYRNGPTVLKACMDVKTHYVDVTDDHDATELLLGYDERCRDAGITAIICCGVSPGITNMLGLLGAGKMDTPREIHTAWVENIADATGDVVWWHGVHMAHGNVPQYLNGEWATPPALSGKTDMEFSAPLGSWPVYYLGHPEPVTLPRYIKGLTTVTNKGNAWPEDADLVRLIKPFSDLGLTGTETVDVNGVAVSKRDFVVNYMRAALRDEGPVTPNPDEPHFCLRVDVVGRTGNTEVRYTFQGAFKDTSVATGLSAAYGAQMLALGKISGHGVFAPEGCLTAVPFFAYLAERDIKIQQTKTIVAHGDI